MHSLYKYLAKNLRGRQGQSGFTLIELLVVVTILGVLAAIVTLSLVGLTTNAEAKACEQEYKTVQAGLDAYMAYNDLTTVAAPQAPTNVMGGLGSTLPLYNPGGTPTFIRNSPTVYSYLWDANGRILSISQSPNGPAKPTACVISG